LRVWSLRAWIQVGWSEVVTKGVQSELRMLGARYYFLRITTVVFVLCVLAGTFADLAMPLLMSACCFWADFLLLCLGGLPGVADAGLAGTGAGEAKSVMHGRVRRWRHSLVSLFWGRSMLLRLGALFRD
jgi:hypothetical protein